MKILSIDVGIKNLALCLFYKPNNSSDFKITKWDIINLTEKESHTCCFIEKNINCNKPSKYVKNNNCYCLKHAKKQHYKIPTHETKLTFITKQKIVKLYEIARKYGIIYDVKIKKDELISLINSHISNHYFQIVENKNASKVDLIDIGRNMRHKFDEMFANEGKIDNVIIENQISPIANRMKTIQGMLVQYFIMSNNSVDNIEFISASNKLKDFIIKPNKKEVKESIKNNENSEKNENTKNNESKIKYNDRKKLGIEKCLENITNTPTFNEHIDYFNNHKKKDDLSDSFLQGLWFINNRNL